MKRSRARNAALAVLAAIVVMTALLGGCAREASREAHGDCACEESSARPVDTMLMAWLSKARTLHHLADLS